MPVPFLEHGPATGEVLAGSVKAGQLVVPDPANAGGIVTAGAAASNVLGVAAADAGVRTNQEGLNPVDFAQRPSQVAIHYGVDIPVKYAAAATYGQLLIAAASGQVAPFTSADQPSAASSGLTPAVPATTVVVQNTSGLNASVVVTGGTMTAVKVNGVTVGAGAGTYFLPAGATISMTYTVAPTWAWTAQISTFDQIVGRCTEPLGVASAGLVGRARIGF